MNSKKSNRKSLNDNYRLLLYTMITIVLFFITVATISNAIHSYNDSSSQKYFTLIESGDYKFKMYQYSYSSKKHTIMLIDESLTDFDIDSLNIAYDEKQYFHTQRELEDIYISSKTDKNKLYVIIDAEHIELQEKIESFNEFDKILDVKDKTQIFNCGNTKSNKSYVFVDGTLNIFPKNIAYWNLGLDPYGSSIITDSEKFYSDYCKNIVPGGMFDLYNYNVYIIVSNQNKQLIKICKLLK